MKQVKQLRGWVYGLIVLVLTGASLPAMGQGTWSVSFDTADMQTSQKELQFNGGANFDAGFYRIDYISGACDYHNSSGTYNLGKFIARSNGIDTGLVVQALHAKIVGGPRPPYGWSSVSATENAAFASGKTSVVFKHAGNAPIGVRNNDSNYSDNSVPGSDEVTFDLIKLENVDKYQLKILIAKSASNNKESEDGITAQSEKPEGYQVEDQTEWLITCKVPGGLKDEEVEFDFAAIFKGVSRKAVKIYDEDGNLVTGNAITWPIEEETKTFRLIAYTSFNAELKLHVVDESEAAKPQINKATETVSGTTDVPVCPAYTDLSAGGCGCGSSCTGESSADPGCLRFQIGIGAVGFDEGGGSLLLLARRPSDGIYKPDSLQVLLNDRLIMANGFTDDGDKIEPAGSSDAIWGEAVLSLHTDGYGYDIKFYEKSGGTLATTPYRTVTIENLNGATSNKELYITETIDLDASTAQKVRMWHFKWTGTSSGEKDDGSWILTEGEAAGATGLVGDTIMRIVERAEVWNGSGDEVTETVTVKEADSTVVSKTEEVWKVYEWGRERTSKTRDPDTTAVDKLLKETWTYYDDLSNDGENNYGRLKSYQSETGYWERYEYDAEGNLSKTMRQHEDEALNTATAFATAASDNIVEAYTEDGAVSVTVGGSTFDVRVEKWQIKVEGTVERTWYRVYVNEADGLISGCTEEWSVRPVTKDPEAGTTLAAVIEDVMDGTDTTSIVAKSWHWEDGASGIGDNEPYDVRAMMAADGQITVYERTITTDERTTVVKRGFSDESLTDILAGTGGADIEYGTKSTAVTDARGNLVFSKSEKISESDNGGAWFITSLVKTDDTDEFGRPTITEYFFGKEAADEVANPGSGTAAYDTRLTFGCCGGGEEEVHTGRDGVQTTTREDVLGRTTYTKRWANTTAAVYSVNEHDAAGRVVASGMSTDDDLDDAADLKSSRAFDKAGRMTSATDEEGRKGYMTYRRVTTSGAAYTGTGVFYWETRAYGNDDDAPVSVTWADSHGRTVLSYTGSGTWAGAPTGTETLTEHSRSTSVYDWDNRKTEGRVYFDIASLAKDASGTAGTNYLVSGKSEYDALGRGYRRTDAAGNITETVYEDGTGRTIKTMIGVANNDLHTVSRVYYKKFVSDNPTGDDRPWPTRVYTVKPNLTAAPNDSDLDDANPTFTDYTYTETVETHSVDATKDYLKNRYLWSRPEHGPWTNQQFNKRGEAVAIITTRNGDSADFLTKSTTTYFTDGSSGDGKPQYRDQYIVNAGVIGTDKVRTEFFYDDAGRQAKAAATGRGYTKTQYDDFGRTERTVFASSEGTNTDANAFTDDIVLTESVPTYDKSGRVTGTAAYERAHDATATGLLSSANADQRRATYAYTWYDDNGRQTHFGTVGTDSSYTYNASSPPEPNTSDDRLVSKLEYDNAGRADVTTDNLGRKTKVFFDNLGRVTHRVENYDAAKLTNGDPDTPASRDADENRVTKNIYDNSATGGGVRIESVAIDPNNDGTTTDNQPTLYIHSGEVNASERGPIPINGRAIAMAMPDAKDSGGSDLSRSEAIAEINAGGEVFGDFMFTEYYANGQVERTTDQRGVQRNIFYTDEGWTSYTTITEATGNTWDSVGDLRTAYTYGHAGEILTITTYDVATGGSSNETSQCTYTYDGFYNVLTEKQDHDPTANSGAGDPKTISWAYDTTVSSTIYSKAHRLDKITYPNGRVIQLNYDGHAGIDDAIGRANAIEEDASGDDIVSYAFLGGGRMVRKDYPTPDVRLDHIDEGSEGSDSNDDYELALDAFGRPTRCQWETYDGSGDADTELFNIAHGYDRNSNRLYDDRKLYTGFSKVYGHDELDRMTTFDQGLIKSDQSAIEGHWVTRTQHFGLDQLGNPLSVKEYINDNTADPFRKVTSVSKSNEIETIKVMGQRRKPAFVEDEFETDTSANYEIVSGDGDAFNVNTTNGELIITNTGTDGETILLIGGEVGMHNAYIYANFPSENGGEAGYVFGYTSPNDYYLAIIDAQNNRRRFYRVVNGSRTTIRSTNVSDFGTGTTIRFSALVGDQIQHEGGFNWLSEGLPAGRVGLYTSQANTEFHYLAVWSDARRPDLAGRWRPNGQTTSGSSRHQIRTAEDVLRVSDWVSSNWYSPAVLETVRADRFEVTYLVEGDQWWNTTYLAFNNKFSHNFDAFHMSIGNGGNFWKVYGKKTVVGSTSISGNPWSADKKWVRVTNDGTKVKAKVIVSNTEPTETDWSNTSVLRETTNLDADGGLIGFGSDSHYTDVHQVTIKTDRDANGTYETTEYEGDFTLDSDGYYEEDLVHDAAGNLTYDGRFAYVYDAINRLVEVKHAYYAPGETTLSYGSVINEIRYDGKSRRISKAVKNSADLDCTFHFYYNSQSCIEERDGSDNVLRQNVWGLTYIDEVVQTSLNNDPDDTGEQDVEQHYYVLQDRQYNVIAIVDNAGVVEERYEYTPYGQRQSYRSLGDSDTLCLSPFYMVERKWVGSAIQPYGRNPFGFQGLYHDEETALINNRARVLNTRLGRFNQRDPLGYPDGMNTYVAYHVLRSGVDPSGLSQLGILVNNEGNPHGGGWAGGPWTVATATAETTTQMTEMAASGNHYAARLHAAWMAGGGTYTANAADKRQVERDAARAVYKQVGKYMDNQGVDAPHNCPKKVLIQGLTSKGFTPVAGTYKKQRWLPNELNMFFAFGKAEFDIQGTATLIGTLSYYLPWDCECYYTIDVKVTWKDHYTFDNTGWRNWRLRNKYYNAGNYLENTAKTAKRVKHSITYATSFNWTAE